jgi:hypothetical protein
MAITHSTPADGTFSATGTTAWNANHTIGAGSISTTELGGDITTAGKELLDDASAAAQLVTLGFTASITELNYTDGVTSAIQTQLDTKAADADVVHETGNETIAGIKTFSSDPLIPDEVYGVGWNGSLEPPTKNAVYDKIETLGGGGTVDTANSPNANEYARFTDADTIEGRTAAEARTDLGVPADADVVHDTGDETIAGVKTFSSDPLIPDEAYGVGWNGSLEPPTKNAVYDKIETMSGGGVDTANSPNANEFARFTDADTIEGRTVAEARSDLGLISAYQGALGYISGISLSYSSTTAFVVSAGELNINGTVRTFAGATYTSATTMKDIADSTVTLGASKKYLVFAYNDAGTVRIAVEDRDGTGDGDEPTFDTTLDYWKAASTGAEARRIAVFWTNASSQIISFYYTGRGRERVLNTVRGPNLINAGSSTTYAAATLTPFVTASDDHYFLFLAWRASSGTGRRTATLSVDSGTLAFESVTGWAGDSGYLTNVRGRPFPNTGTLHYLVTANGDVIIDLLGLGLYV